MPSILGVSVLPLSAQTEDNDSLRLEQLQEVTVIGVRAQPNAPFAVSNISKNRLQNFSTSGQELPFLFAQTPGIYAWSENGLGTGTTYMRIRGAAGSRINVTLDGVALNSPEDQTVFWANMNSYAALMGSAQIQRGIGTSTNGDGAFGGTISLNMAAPSVIPELKVTASYGSYNTYNVGAGFSTGLLWNHLIFDGAYHHTGTDGFLHGTSGNSGSYYGGLTWLSDNLKISYKNIGNYEHTGQAWNGVTAGNDDATLMGSDIRTYRDLYNHGLGKFNSLYEGLVCEYVDKKWNFPKDKNGNYQTKRYTMADGSLWEKTTDNFIQNHNILSLTLQPSYHWSHHVALHYTYGHGYYKEFRPNTKFKKFGLLAVDEGYDVMMDKEYIAEHMIKRGDLIRRKGLTQHTYGILYNMNYKNETLDIVSGLNLQHFCGNHFGFIDYIHIPGKDKSKIAFQTSWKDGKYYDSDATKKDYSVFLKGTWHLSDAFDFFGDLQYRYVNYRISGMQDNFTLVDNIFYSPTFLDLNMNYHFFNPKAGISFHRNGHQAYVSAAYAGREPERNNFTDNGKYPAPNPEHLLDIEAGYNFSGDNWHAGLNLYYMHYIDQFVQTGEQSDIGENLTTNIAKSYRLGIELSADWSPLSWMTIAGNAALSKNKILDFTEFVEDWYAKKGFRTIHYDNSTLAYSPSAILNGFLNFHYKNFQGIWHTNYVSRIYLDNTANKDRSLPGFTQTNINLNYTFRFATKSFAPKELVLGVRLNNIFDSHYANSGWVYSAYDKENMPDNADRYYQIGFIPMAGFTAMGNITLKF